MRTVDSGPIASDSEDIPAAFPGGSELRLSSKWTAYACSLGNCVDRTLESAEMRAPQFCGHQLRRHCGKSVCLCKICDMVICVNLTV